MAAHGIVGFGVKNRWHLGPYVHPRLSVRCLWCFGFREAAARDLTSELEVQSHPEAFLECLGKDEEWASGRIPEDMAIPFIWRSAKNCVLRHRQGVESWSCSEQIGPWGQLGLRQASLRVQTSEPTCHPNL
jgi:hypothetical protein